MKHLSEAVLILGVIALIVAMSGKPPMVDAISAKIAGMEVEEWLDMQEAEE